MADMWEELLVAKKENRRELTLHGADINKRIEKNGLDRNIYKLINLNFLAITNSCLTQVSASISDLSNLGNLVLRNNQLDSLPPEIGKLTKLKMLDVSGNMIEIFPAEITQLTELQSLNASMNKLSCFPDVSNMTALHILNLSHNQLKCFPDGITNENLCHLADVNLCHNLIEEIPGDISNLVHLTTLNLSDNKIKDVPLEISKCPKLKELVLTGNKLSDRRLGKMTEQCQTKAVLDYLANALQKQSGETKGKKNKGRKKKSGKKDDVEELAKNFFNIVHFDDEDGLTIQVKQEVLPVRPYFVSCIVRNLNFNKSVNMFKRFINLQTKLHDTVCNKRQAATIATHDFKLIKSPLIYTALSPRNIKIIPLFKTKESTAVELVAGLRKEADDIRKEKKRNNIGGVHKYLDLLKDKTVYPCLIDGEGQVISFPPITNSDKTKITKETTEILIEVTSSTNLDVCKAVMDEILKEMLEMGIGSGSDAAGGGDVNGAVGGTEDGGEICSGKPEALTVEQVRVIDEEGGLRVLYPSRMDLKDDVYEVKRE